MQVQTEVLLHSKQIRIISNNSHVQIYTYTRMQERDGAWLLGMRRNARLDWRFQVANKIFMNSRET